MADEIRKAPHKIVLNTGGEPPAAPDQELPTSGMWGDEPPREAPAPPPVSSQNGSGPTASSPWMVELATVQELIESESRRQAALAASAVVLALLAIAIAARAVRLASVRLEVPEA